jgi:hypothetical protein
VTLAAAQVVEAVADRLRAVPAWVSDKVFTDRAHPFEESELPAWRVYADEEEVETTGPTYPAREKRELVVLCEGVARDVDGLDAVLNNELAAPALASLYATKAAASLSPLNCSMTTTRIERARATEGEAAVGRITLALRVRFHTFNNSPETIV